MNIRTRDHARIEISKAGITTENVTKNQLKLLHECLDKSMKQSGNYRNSYRMNKKIGKFMTCRTDQWENREAVSFNRDGFIGFAGWADESNVLPILNGISDWLISLSLLENAHQQIQYGFYKSEIGKHKDVPTVGFGNGSVLVSTMFSADGHVGITFTPSPGGTVVGQEEIDAGDTTDSYEELPLMFLFDNPKSIDVVVERLLTVKKSLK